MKQYAILCIAVMMLLMSCKKNLPFLTSSNLPGTIISLDANSGYTLQTPKGAIIKIDSGSFDLPANAKLTLEVKEAYSEKDILLAGLTTVSDGRLLESGGMIYFNATADGKPVSILKPIHISIPTKKYNANMQLFKGQVAKDSSINWVNPQPLDSVTNTTPNGVAPSDSTKIDTVMEGDYPMDSASADAPCGYEYDTLYTPIPDTMTVIPAATVANNTVQAPYVPPASVYAFNISEEGWYNIDCFIDNNINAVTTVHLKAILSDVPDAVKNMEVYIAIPSRKLLSNERGNDGNAYTFYDAGDDSIQLILHDDAFIFAIGNDGDKVYYGFSRFTVKEQQSVDVTILPSTKAAVTKSLLDNDLDSTKIDPDVPEIVDYGLPNYNNADTSAAPGETKQIEIIQVPCGQNLK